MNTKKICGKSTLYSSISTIFKSDWMLDLHEYTVITRGILDKFGLNEDEPTFSIKIKRLRLPYEEISSRDKRLFLFNDVTKEMENKPYKKQWILMTTRNFKKALFLIGGTRLHSDLRNFYLDLENVVRKHLLIEQEYMSKKSTEESSIENALEKFTKIIDDKLIKQLSI